jgi:multiple sugar transport system ATP-binding protein
MLEPGPTAAVKARVEVAELMGNENILYLRVGADSVIARVPPRYTPKPGSGLDIRFDLARLHFFDPKTEATLTAAFSVSSPDPRPLVPDP